MSVQGAETFLSDHVDVLMCVQGAETFHQTVLMCVQEVDVLMCVQGAETFPSDHVDVCAGSRDLSVRPC